MNKIVFPVLILLSLHGYAQDLPYREIPPAPATYSGPNVAARLVDGLGFRYYWATEGLRPDDLNYEPVNAGGDARTSFETINHIYDLSVILVNSINGVTNISGTPKEQLDFSELRRRTLQNLKYSSDKLKASTEKDMASYKILFKNGETSGEFPFWNEINGPIADALWHVGQVITFRRSSGNPYNSKVSLLQGKLIE